MSRLLTLSKKLVLPALALALLFASPAMAAGLVAHDPPHSVSVGGAQGGGGSSQLSGYQPAQAFDPGQKLNVLKADDKPLNADSFLARDVGRTNVLTAKDPKNLIKIPIRARDMGSNRAYEVLVTVNRAYEAALPTCTKNGQYNCHIPTCGEQAHGYTDPCWPADQSSPVDCWQKDELGLPCPKG